MDICLCASENCARRQSCLRATIIDNQDKPGIYTVSYLGETCNANTGYECYIYDDREEKKK